jgi:CubicO group peptidase (beta-lactamase class C family)
MSYSSYGYELLGEIVRRVSGQSLADFCRKRIFDPLGMADTHYIVPDSVKHRIVRRAKGAPWAAFFTQYKVQETPWASFGAYSTAMDVARFGQMFLNRGVYGETRILSPASVVEMTRNQIPGISARFGDKLFPAACWGLGWNVHGTKRAVGYNGTLQSPQAFSHGGGGGVLLWVDPACEIVGVYFSVCSERGIPAGVTVGEDLRPELMGRKDLFVNAVTAAITD